MNDEHYKCQGIDTIARVKANCTLYEQKAICQFNIDKYLWREKNQNMKDLDKIHAYMDWLTEIINELEINPDEVDDDIPY